MLKNSRLLFSGFGLFVLATLLVFSIPQMIIAQQGPPEQPADDRGPPEGTGPPDEIGTEKTLPDQAGPPEGKGPPDQPADDRGPPEGTGPPDEISTEKTLPDQAGPLDDVGKPDATGKPEGAGKPEFSFGGALAENLSPLKQMEAGVAPEDVQCRFGLELIQKPSGSVACVTQSSISKLVDIGWIEIN